MSLPTIIIPAPEQREIDRKLRDQYQIWRTEKEAAQPEFVIENVRFPHNPNWRNNVISIQAAHDAKHPLWWGGRLLFSLAAISVSGSSIFAMAYLLGWLVGSF